MGYALEYIILGRLDNKNFEEPVILLSLTVKIITLSILWIYILNERFAEIRNEFRKRIFVVIFHLLLRTESVRQSV